MFPGDLLEHNYPDPENPDRLTGRTEVERRGEYFEQLEQSAFRQHQSMIQLTKDCLHNTPSRRPTAEQLVVALEGMKADIEGPYGEFSKLDAVRQVAIMKALRGKEEDVREKTDELREKTDELTEKNGEIQQLQQQLQHAQVQNWCTVYRIETPTCLYYCRHKFSKKMQSYIVLIMSFDRRMKNCSKRIWNSSRKLPSMGEPRKWFTN